MPDGYSVIQICNPRDGAVEAGKPTSPRTSQLACHAYFREVAPKESVNYRKRIVGVTFKLMWLSTIHMHGCRQTRLLPRVSV